MKRRNFIYNTSLIAMSVGVFGKIKWDGKAWVGEDPTTTDILGPFYRPGAPFKTDLVQPGTKGQLLHFGGTVFAKNGSTPLKDTLVMRMERMITLRMIMCTGLLPKPAVTVNIISKLFYRYPMA